MDQTDVIWPRDALPKGTNINGYRIDAVIGRGGFGITYRATDGIDQVFAVKECFPKQFAVRQNVEVFPSDHDSTEPFNECLSRFGAEARALRQLAAIGAAGDGVVKVVTFFQASGTAYVIMEFLAGDSLDRVIKAQKSGIDPVQLDFIVPRLLHATACVHSAGLLHRDIKPANIILREDGRPVLIDFGAARTTSQGRTVTFTQIFSEGYAPIEQFSGTRQGPFSDIYALGATLYRAIGGTAVDSFTRHQALLRGKRDPQPPAAEIGAGRYNERLLTAVDAAMIVAPEDRPQSVRELLGLLEDKSSAESTVVASRQLPLDYSESVAPRTSSVKALSTPANVQVKPQRKRLRLVFLPVIFGVAVAGGAVYLTRKDQVSPARYRSQPPTAAMSQATTLPSPPNIEARDQARAALTEAQTTRESNTKAQAALDSSVDAELDADNMVRIPGGSFTMGSTSTETSRAGVPDQFAASERPPHAVVIRSFALAKYDVTFDDWDACVNDGGCDGYRPDDHGWGRGKRPVINVSWADAQSYITWFSAKRGHSFRLPTEAEWEYAARAGTTTAYYWGDAIGDNNANCGHCGSAWDGKKTAPVGSFAANPWGLYDMSGNVWQWTFDCWHDNYSGAPNDGSSWTTTYGISSLGMTSAIPGCTAQSVIRGGAWNGDPRYLRSATRHWGKAGERHFNLSFRLALTLP